LAGYIEWVKEMRNACEVLVGISEGKEYTVEIEA
jgi:predicted RNA-binding protein with TRAM domain